MSAPPQDQDPSQDSKKKDPGLTPNPPGPPQLFQEIELLKQGAEARVFLIKKYRKNLNCIAKQRFPKRYRIKELDEKLTKERVLQEARMIVR